jgi:cytochrome c oxidase assembly protein subunit 15
MNGNFFPDDVTKYDLFGLDTFNNASVVQFYHRITAFILVVLLAILNFFFYTKNIYLKPILLLNLSILFQVILGIITLLTGVKIYYASLHQLGSVFVLTSFIYIYYKNTN